MKDKTRSNPSRRWAIALLGALVLSGVLVAFGSTRWGATFGAAMGPARLERARRFPFFRDGAFVNTHPTAQQRSGSIASASLGYFFGGERREPPHPLPAATDGAAILQRPPETGLRLTWIGHSTVLVEVDGLRFLTDPQFSERASPSTLFGPKRFQPPALALDQLGGIDGVLISHDHYDHLDMASVQKLAAMGARFYVPLGVGAHLEKWGIAPDHITELVWWEEASPAPSFRLVSTPSQHFSGRSLGNRDSTLWTSWSILGPAHRVFFSGDTGLSPDFQDIGQKLGPFDVALFEIGACHPAWGDIHLGPARALEAFRLLGARWFLPIHWGTFNLALHAWDQPIEAVFAEAPQQGIPLLAPQLGEPLEPDRAAAPTAWWRAAR